MQLWTYRPYTEGCVPTGRVPVLLNTVEGARSLDEVLDDTARCFRMRRRSRLVHLVLRGSVEALRDLTFGVAVGELVCIVGPSGAGKSTLLRCISGLLEPTSGEVVLQGEQVTGPPRGMAVVFQEYGRSLFPWMTVRQNVELPLKEKKVPR
ncbi:MAG: NitT/TauT family transport system ATP-binding protein, partial [Pseudonocardiales bacterium]|nr:NitT/TauT family transport system ATP-binding protein [Pseudonocardiales bacterium]